MSDILFETSKTKHLIVKRGDDKKYRVRLRDDVGRKIDATGYTFSAQIRDKQDSTLGTLLGEFTLLISESVYTTGDIVFKLENSLTTTLPNNCYYEIQLTNTDGDIKTILEGRIEVVNQVTL